MDLALILKTIRATPDCNVRPPRGLPRVAPEHVLPGDLQEFYQLCGGVTLFGRADYPISIVPPEEMVLANAVILRGVSEPQLAATADDISWSWYIVGVEEGHSSMYITIDLSPERLGRCYDSYWEIHPGNSTIIATSFTHLLEQLLSNRGERWYWVRPGFHSLGSPYDREQ
jgi:antitoxin YokJ